MPFNQATFAPISANSTAAPASYSYSTTEDDIDDVLAADYFSDKANQLVSGCTIYVDASDTEGFIVYRGVGFESSLLTSVSSGPYRFEIIVHSADDLAGTLRSDVIYYIDGVIDMGAQSIEVPAAGLNIKGHDFDVSKLISSEAGYTMFVSPVGGSGNLLVTDVGFTVSGSGSQMFDLTDATGLNAFEFNRVNYNSCESLGVITGYRQGLEFGTGRFGGSPQITLDGTWLGGYRVTTSIIRSLDSGFSGTLFSAGASFIMNSRFRTDINCDLPAGASLADFAPADFAEPSLFQVNGAIISRNGVFDATDTNIFPNIDKADKESQWIGNVGIGNTFEGGRLTITSEVATTGTGSFTPILGTWTSSDLQHFDSPSNGQIRHLGNTPREYKATIELILESTANNEVEVRLRKYDSSSTSTSTVFSSARQVNSLVGSRDVAFLTVIDNVELDQNDYVFLEVRNNTAANNITAEINSVFFLERR